MRISLDGIEYVHNYYRKQKDGSNSFIKTMQGIKLLQKHNIPFLIGATVTEMSIPYLQQNIDFFKSLNPKRIILTAQMFPDEDGSKRIKTQQIYFQAKEILKNELSEKISLNGFHQRPEEPYKNLEILLKYDKIELNIVGYKTPTLQTFSYDEISKLKEATNLLCNL